MCGVVVTLAASVNAQSSGFWLVGYPPGGTNNVVKALSKDGSLAHGHGYGMPGFLNASFSWTQQGGRNDWGIGPGMPGNNLALCTSSSGLIVAGDTWFEGDRAFRQVGDGPLENLGVLPGEMRSYANGMSGDGTIVVGYCEKGPNPYQFVTAFRWTQADGMHPVGKLTPLSSKSDARAISRDGSTIVGFNKNEFGWFQGFVWNQASGMKALAAVNGAPSESEANAVNADGTVIVGSSTSMNGKTHATRWIAGQPEDLAGNFLGNFSLANSVSDDGSVIGGAYQVSPTNAGFVWTGATGMVNAKDYLTQQGVSVPNNYELEDVYAVSGDGRTFGGMARNPASNKKEGWIATIPGPNTCVPDCDQSGTLNIDDFICFQTYFALGEPKADCDASGSLNIDDFICFQTSFVLGC